MKDSRCRSVTGSIGIRMDTFRLVTDQPGASVGSGKLLLAAGP